MREKNIPTANERFGPRPASIPGAPWFVRTLPVLLAGLGFSAFSGHVAGMGLGSASTQSRIGGPLRIEIPILAEDAERIESSCLRLAPVPAAYSEELPWLSKAKLSLEKQGNTRLLVVSSPSNSHPALMLGIQIGCGMEMRRDYTLLLNPPLGETNQPSSPVIAPAFSQPAAPVVAPKTAAADTLRTTSGDTARSIANRLYPGDVSAQRRMARALLIRNASVLQGRQGTYDSLPAGIELEVPPLPDNLPARAEQQASESPPVTARPAPAKLAPARAPLSARQGRDRLLVSSAGEDGALKLSTDIGQRKELNEDQRNRLRTELQLIATLDEKIATQLELADRLRQLEAMQTRLKADADRLESELRAQQTTQASAPASTPADSQSRAAVATANTNTPTPSAPWYTAIGWIAAALLGLAALLGAGWWFWRRQNTDEHNGDTIPVPNSGLEGEVGEHLIEPLSEADIWPDEEGHAPRANPRVAASMEGALGMLSASGLGPASMLQILDDDVEEHDSAVELADIMMSFGRVQGAAQTLADFIRANPKQAVKPWIKLLEVYRAADMRVEYEALTTQLNKTFNVKTIAWDDFDIARQAPESLENMPHIMTRLAETWGRRDCQVFLHELLRDNRQGTRQGFPLAIIDEILLLLGILESQIGPFRPETGDQTLASPTRGLPTGPATLPLAVAPIVLSETPDTPVFPPAPAAEAQPFTSSSISQLDFELDMTDLSKTLHLNLDDLTDSDSLGDKH